MKNIQKEQFGDRRQDLEKGSCANFRASSPPPYCFPSSWVVPKLPLPLVAEWAGVSLEKGREERKGENGIEVEESASVLLGLSWSWRTATVRLVRRPFLQHIKKRTTQLVLFGQPCKPGDWFHKIRLSQHGRHYETETLIMLHTLPSSFSSLEGMLQ